MRKTMYSAMKNLAEYIAKNESYDFDIIWEEWSSRYKPLEGTVPELKKMGESLCQIDKSDIKSVPERGYRETIKRMLKPEINKEEFVNEHVSDKGTGCSV